MIRSLVRPLAFLLLTIQLAAGPLASAQVDKQSAGALPASAQNDKQGANQDKPIRLGANEVVVDAVVLDKKNKLITDLTAEDFEIYEDGVRQKITSFRLESGSTAAGQASANPSTTAVTTASGTPNLISFVFDAQNTREGAMMSRRAALEYIDTRMAPNDYAAVFGIDMGLMLLSAFSQDKTVLKNAVDSFTSQQQKKYGFLAQEVRAELDKFFLPGSDGARLAVVDGWEDQDFTTPAPGSEVPTEARTVEAPSPASLTVMRNQLNLSMLRTLRTYERFERETQGRNVIGALLSVIAGQRGMRGRKVLLFFSEGFPIATAVSEQFRSVISAANSAGVTIYSIDVAGLRLVNPDEYAQIEKEAASRNALRNRNPELIQGGQSALGRMEEAMGLNTVSNLDALSEETGGYTIKNTNDLADGLRRISEEMGSFYVLTYVPANQNFDGKYRKVAVKLARPADYRVRARRGYYAFRTLDYSPVLAFELPLIERASQRELPQEFPIYAEALHFRGSGTTRLVPIYVELPVSAMKIDTDEKKKSFSARYAILVLVKDENQQVVRKMGQDFVLRGPIAQVEATRQQPHLFSRLISLRPGRYSVEAVARDGGTGKMSGTRIPLEVPEVSDSQLRLSSIVLSRGVNPLTEEQKKDSRNPLFLDGQAYFIPNARETFRKSTDKNLLLHFSAYPAKASKLMVQATVELLQAGKVISKSSGTLGAADATGRIVYVNSFPMESFGVGQYQLRVTVTDGVSQASSLSSFVVEQ